jgi:hypothetical protein
VHGDDDAGPKTYLAGGLALDLPAKHGTFSKKPADVVTT